MRKSVLVLSAFVLGAAAVPATAQLGGVRLPVRPPAVDVPPLVPESLTQPVRVPSVDVPALEGVLQIVDLNGGRNGHDDCNGNGHEEHGNGNGNGHEEGECDEDEGGGGEVGIDVPSPVVVEEVCYGVDNESAWRRYTCGVAGEAEGYAGELNDYSSETINFALGDGTAAVALLVPPPDRDGPLVSYSEEAVSSIFDFADGALGLAPRVPQPGPILDDFRQSINETPTSALRLVGDATNLLRPETLASDLTANPANFVQVTTASLLNFSDGALGLAPRVPQPGPVLDEVRGYIGTLSEPVVTDPGQFVTGTVGSVLDFADGALGLAPRVPQPGPILDEARTYVTAYTETVVADPTQYAVSSATTVLNFGDGALGLAPRVPQPGPILDEALQFEQIIGGQAPAAR